MITKLYAWQYRIRLSLAGHLHRLQNPRNASPAIQAEPPIPAPRRLLLIIAGLIGDSVMCTPVILEARRIWPDAEITLLGQRHNCELLEGCPDINSRHETSAIPFSILKRRKVKELREWIVSRRFDAAIILLGDEFGLILAEAGIPVRVGVQRHPLASCLTHTYDNATRRTWGPHEGLNSLRVLGYGVRDVPPRLWVTDQARRSAAARLQEFGIRTGARYAIVHPFGRTAPQWWPARKVQDLAVALRRNYDMRILVMGRKSGKRLESTEPDTLMDARGRFTLPELLAVAERADLVISTDSGPFHLAGALGRPLVGLFRSSRPEHAARYPHARVLFGEDPSCKGRCRWDYCRTAPCRQMAAISVEQVLGQVELAGIAS